MLRMRLFEKKDIHFVKESVTSPNLTPHVLITARLSMTLSSTKKNPAIKLHVIDHVVDRQRERITVLLGLPREGGQTPVNIWERTRSADYGQASLFLPGKPVPSRLADEAGFMWPCDFKGAKEPASSLFGGQYGRSAKRVWQRHGRVKRGRGHHPVSRRCCLAGRPSRLRIGSLRACCRA